MNTELETIRERTVQNLQSVEASFKSLTKIIRDQRSPPTPASTSSVLHISRLPTRQSTSPATMDLTEDGLSYNRLRTIDRSEVISNIELLFDQLSDPDSGFNKETRTLEPRQLYFAVDLKSATTKFFNQSHEDELLLDLSKDTSIIITKPDKGRGVVIMNRSDYIEKLGQILRNRSKFKLLNKNPTVTQQYRYIKPVGSIPARLYGLTKVHKTNVPLRPIVSCIQSYNYRLELEAKCCFIKQSVFRTLYFLG
ncbi:unnamed protein product [Adineta steineri]|uniref:Uncharacterized protein n=1 Tax=Adineta steineri TaxID=433720 RepID=A0A819QM94_9BILA|nr:unnamed protein product [Adineta steineri]